MIDATPGEIETIRDILGRFVPGAQIRVFGSRVNGRAKPWSDLDLAVVGTGRLDDDVMRLLREAFEESDLPYRVDVVDWHAISESFRAVIDRGYQALTDSP
ncbi:MAG: nucleotidyltransferase domain-containing protein [Deltaproteobacteria bacterium]|nr:nucleotidyltransferase domain-containing protein [Deltaproteobacteria bacterium]